MLPELVITFATLLCLTRAETTINQVIFRPHNYSINEEGERVDFIISFREPLTSPHKECNASQACLIRKDKVTGYKLQKNNGGYKFVYSSSDGKCFLKVVNYCNSAWQPPLFTKGVLNCDYLVEIHSPYACKTENSIIRDPCYTYNTNGDLVDLTPLIKTNGSDYSLDTSLFKDFNLTFNINVCNEAHKTCGPQVAACASRPEQGHIEAGYTNSTHLSFNAQTNMAQMTYLGHINDNCDNNFITTTVNFKCGGSKIGVPKLLKHDNCKNEIEWQSVYACPVREIQKPFAECTFKSEFNNLDIDLNKVFNKTLTVDNFDNENSTFIFTACQGILCGTKKTSQTSACLIKSKSNTTKAEIIGSVQYSSKKFVSDRLNLDYFSANDTSCELPPDNNGFKKIARQGARIEIFCERNASWPKPKFLGINDCIYTFEWGRVEMCFDLNSDIASPTIPSIASNSTSTSTPPNQTILMHPDPRAPQATKLPSSSSPLISVGQKVESQSALPSPSKTSSQRTQSQPSKPSNNSPKSNWQEGGVQKFFMISLISIALVAFIVGMIIVDKKTKFSRPLRHFRGRLRRDDESKAVPYSRMNEFNVFLDL